MLMLPPATPSSRLALRISKVRPLKRFVARNFFYCVQCFTARTCSQLRRKRVHRLYALGVEELSNAITGPIQGACEPANYHFRSCCIS